MKKLLIITFILLLSVSAFSQTFNFGIKAGAESNTTPKYDISSGLWNIEAMRNSSWGFHGGIFARINFEPLYFQPEVVFASNTFDYKISGTTSVHSSFIYNAIESQKFNKLSIPILIGLKFGPLRINAGPAASIQLGSPKALIDDPIFDDMYKETVWGFQAGIGIDIFKALNIDFRYAGSLGERYGDAITIGNQTYKLDYGQKSFLVSIGLAF